MIRRTSLVAASLVLALGMTPLAAQQSGMGSSSGTNAGSSSGSGSGASGSSGSKSTGPKSGGASSGASSGTSGGKRLSASDCGKSYSSSMGLSRAEFDRQCMQYRSKK